MRTFPLLLVCFCWLALGLGLTQAKSNGDAGDLYLKGYTLKNEAEKLDAAGQASQAMARYQQAQQIISSVAQSYPTWQPEVVQYRLVALQQAISKLEARTGISAGSVAPMPAPVAAPAPTYGAPAPAPAYQAPMPNAAPAAPVNPNDPFEAIRRDISGKEAKIRELEEKLNLYGRYYIDQTAAVQKAQQDVSVLLKQQEQLKAMAADAEKRAQSATESSQNQMGSAQQELARAKEELKMVEGMLAAKNVVVTDATKSVEEYKQATEALKKEKETLLGDNKKLTEENRDLKGQIATFEKDGVKMGDYSKLMADNTRLKQELETARQQVEELKTSGSKKDVEIAQLKTQLTTIQGQLAQLDSENTEYQKQVADLTVKLKEMSAGLSKVPDSVLAVTDPKASKLSTENKTLRNIILRQLRGQERQRQAKELVIAEMQKMKNTSETLINNLEQMTSSKVMITVDEESLFSAPELNEIYGVNAARTTLVATSSKGKNGKNQLSVPLHPQLNGPTATAPVNTERRLLSDAQDAIQKGDIKAAELAFQDALRANPKNVSARADLASLKLQGQHYDEAEIELKKCLVYEPENDTALYRLGVCYFQQNKLPEAEEQFERSIASKAENARAHHYLGIIQSKLGKREKAEAEFKQALAIDPNYGDAHFNLAVLYATTQPPDLALARKHYEDAIAKGIKADPALEKLLNPGAGTSAEPKSDAPAVSAR